MGAPALLDAQATQVLAMLNTLRAAFSSRAEGAIVSDNGTAIATSEATITLDHTAAMLYAGSASASVVAASALALTETLTFTATSGLSAIAAVVADISGAPAVVAVWGAEAATGSQVSPTDADISAALGHSLWVRLCDVDVEITGAATGNFAFDNTARNSVVAPPADFLVSDV